MHLVQSVKKPLVPLSVLPLVIRSCRVLEREIVMEKIGTFGTWETFVDVDLYTRQSSLD
jgi:hypothetical protein